MTAGSLLTVPFRQGASGPRSRTPSPSRPELDAILRLGLHAAVAHTGPVHGIVEATPAWVARRLHALAATLVLPCPVRDAFFFPADKAFYDLCTASVISLQQATRRIVEHLGLACDTVVVAFRSDLPNPARIERDGAHWFIEIALEHRDDGPVLGAILAHECCHILLEERRIPHFGTAVDEVHVDLALMLAGLGALTLNAIEDRTITTSQQTVTVHRSFGYLRAKLLRYAHAHVAASLGVGLQRALQPLRAAPSRSAVRFHHLTRLLARRAKLAYGPLASHVILPCSSVTCARRLRVPTGAIGKARCPECGASRSFDGRPLSIDAGSTPAPMVTAPLPGNSLMERTGRFFYNLPGDARVSIVLLLALFGVPIGLWLKDEISRAPLGEACASDRDCRSQRCLFSALGSKDAPVFAGLRPQVAGLGACTRMCKDDQECPSGFACEDGLSFTAFWGKGEEIRVCVRRTASDAAGDL